MLGLRQCYYNYNDITANTVLLKHLPLIGTISRCQHHKQQALDETEPAAANWVELQKATDNMACLTAGALSARATSLNNSATLPLGGVCLDLGTLAQAKLETFLGKRCGPLDASDN